MTYTRTRRPGALAALPLALLLLSTGTAPQAAASTIVSALSVSTGPVLAEPPAGATVTDVVLRWLPVTGATEYELQVSPNGDWANNLSFSVTVKGFQYSPPTTLDNGSYFWRVRGSAGTVKGPWSEERLLSRAWTPVPELLSPADGDLAVAVPTFRWTSVTGASRYELQVGPDVNFSPSTYMTCSTDHTSYTPYRSGCNVDPAIGVTYYWRVRGLDDPGNVLGRWSATWSFLHRKPLPTMTGPANGSTVSAPVLAWDPVGDSEQYVVSIYRANGTVADTHETWATSYSPLKALKPADGPFSWFVRTKEYNQNLGLAPERSAWWTFALETPSSAGVTPVPASVTPAQGSPRAPSLTWTPVTGAVTYTVNYMSGGVFTPLQSGVPFAALTDPDKPVAVGEFTWFVEAYGTGGAYLGRGPESTFQITQQDVPSYLAPCEVGQVCQNQLDTPQLRWRSVVPAGYYRVYLAQDRAFTNIVAEYVTQYTELTPRESLLDNQAGQSYYWLVRACSGVLCGPFRPSEHAGAATFRKQTRPVTGLKVTVEGATSSLVWDDYLTARQYRVQVSGSPDFAPLADDISVDQRTYASFSKPYPGGVPLYARVFAIDGSRNLLTPSSPVTFTLPASAPILSLSRAAISAGDTVTVTYQGAPGSSIEVLSRTQPATAFSRIATLTLDAHGRASSTHKPNKNTRMAARTAAGTMSTAQPLIAVRSLASLNVVRVRTRTYTFTGRVYPALQNRLVNVYRDGSLVAQARCGATGVYTVTRTLGSGTFSFETRTPNDTYNLGATSVRRVVSVH